MRKRQFFSSVRINLAVISSRLIKRQTAASTLCITQRNILIVSAPVIDASIMIIEVLGARILATCISNAQFVWTAQIVVAMVALAVGYTIGGSIADRSKSRSPIILFICTLTAALTLISGTLFFEPVASVFLQLGHRAGSLLTSTAIYFIPFMLLATAPPILVRSLAANLDNIGRTVGRLSAISTIGGVLGSLAIGYLLFPDSDGTCIMLATAAILAVFASTCFIIWRVTDTSFSISDVLEGPMDRFDGNCQKLNINLESTLKSP